MFSRTETIDGFHFRVSHTEKELFDAFAQTEEPEIVEQIQEYFAQPKGSVGGIRLDDRNLWSKIESLVEVWLSDACVDRRIRIRQVSRARDAILQRLRDLFARTIRDSLGAN